MKNALVTVLVLICSNIAIAQVTDTLGWSGFAAGTETLYESPNGGYAFGNNGYNDKAKAQSFIVSESLVLKGALLKFGAVEFNSQDSSSAVLVNVYLNNGRGITLSSNADTLAPDSIIISRELFLKDLIENEYTNVDFSADTLVFQPFQKFSIGISFDSLAVADTVGLVSTTDEDAGATQNAWELTVDNNWIVVAQPAYSWNLDVDLGIFALIDRNDPASIAEIRTAEQLYLYPNPALRSVNLDLTSFEQAKTVEVKVLNQFGQVVRTQTCSGSAVQIFDVSGLSQGIYSVRVTDNSKTAIGRFMKL